MKLWILRPRGGLNKDDNPWEPWFDKAFGFVVRAPTEVDARRLASMRAGNECQRVIDCYAGFAPVPAWTDPKYSTCAELLPDGEAEIIMRDFAGA